jgi:hypothetical protein
VRTGPGRACDKSRVAHFYGKDVGNGIQRSRCPVERNTEVSGRGLDGLVVMSD